MKTILLKFAGPLQSWGTDSHFETRHTDYYPSKSAVVGLLAAAMGLSRSDDENVEKLNQLGFAVRIDQQGKLLRDFHIAQKYKKDGSFDRNYVTNRYYMEDAVYIVGVTGPDDQMQTLYACLERPCFQLYMGRRALPVPNDYLIGIFDEDLLPALENIPWQAAPWYQRRHQSSREVNLDIYGDSQMLKMHGQKHMRRDSVRSFSQKERTFSMRSETRCCVKVINPGYEAETEHDVFAYIG